MIVLITHRKNYDHWKTTSSKPTSECGFFSAAAAMEPEAASDVTSAFDTITPWQCTERAEHQLSVTPNTRATTSF